MNGIEKITRQIAAEAESEIAALRAEAEERSAAARAEYARQADAEEEKLLQAGKDAAEQRVQRQERTARLEARKDILALKQELVSQTYDLARKKILSLPEEKYVAFLAAQAGAAAVTGTEEILLSREDTDRLGEKLLSAANAAAAARGLPGKITLAAADRPMEGGLVLRQGNVEVNCTLDKLLEMSHSRLDAEVASVLFG